MHIKQLEIEGFKSYREQAGVQEFSPGLNTIVGRNGSGKSNFFRAIQFVLGEKSFSNLSHKERAELLHEGAGASVMTAHVQIVFDNTERRLPLDADEVVLRRTIGLKKDEYFLNLKQVTKADVNNLLESAGFSRSNPYYIVQQGKVNSLCLMKDEQRLELLKEVAGTNVYEERRKNSEAILTDTKNKREKIKEVVSYIESRLDELEGEKEELEKFRLLHRRKRALEYTLHELEIRNAASALENLEQEHNKRVEATNEASSALTEVREQIDNLDNEIKQTERQLKRSEQEAAMMAEECANLLKAKAACELKYKDVVERGGALQEQATIYEGELAEIERKMTAIQENLETVSKPALKVARSESDALKAAVKALERKKFELESKQGRKSQFTNQEERNAWLNGEIENIRATIKEKVRSRVQLEETIKENETKMAVAANEVVTLAKDLEESEDKIRKAAEEVQDLKRNRDQASEERKQLWRKGNDLENNTQQAAAELAKAERDLKRSIPSAVASGLSALDKIAEDLGLQKNVNIFGPLYELIQPVQEEFETAVEVAAGQALTHVVVDNDETASRLMHELQARKAGRLTFKPLAQIKQLRERQPANQVNGDDVDHDIVGLDDGDGTTVPDALPLISRVTYPPEVRLAVRAVLGKTLLCKDSQVAAIKRREHKVNCVTLAGEEVNRRGALTGGFHDERTNKLRAAIAIRQAREQLAQLQNDRDEASRAATQKEQQVTQLMSQLNRAEGALEHVRSSASQIQSESQKLQEQVKPMQSLMEQDKLSLEACVQGIQHLEEQLTTLENELKTPMQDMLSQEEQQVLTATRAELVQRRRDLTVTNEKLASASAKVRSQELELEANLERRKNEILVAMGRAKPSVNGPHPPTPNRQGKGKGKQQARSALDILDDEDEDDDEDDDVLMSDDPKKSSELDTQGLTKLEFFQKRAEELKAELQTAEERLEEGNAQLAELEKEAAVTRESLASYRAELVELNEQEHALTKDLQKLEEQLDKIQTKRSVQQEKRDLNAQKIRELGSLSNEEIEKIDAHRDATTLEKEIRKINVKLGAFDHVNKKALDQFISFTDRREALLNRKTELDKAEESITDLMQHLDTQKDEDILRTFRGVAKHFREVFFELVPEGKAELVMVTRSSADSQDTATSSNSDREHHVDEFVGVSPRVSFTGKGDQFHMRQLSGGQRALVALTLIFAIQRCDPGPFYLLDEVDAPLDNSRRAAVAAMIQRQSESAQFIVTSFRPEIVQVADKIYGVQFQSKVSSLVQLKVKDALKFVETTMASEGGSRMRSERKRVSRGNAKLENEKDDSEESSNPAEGSEEAGDTPPRKLGKRASAASSSGKQAVRDANE